MAVPGIPSRIVWKTRSGVTDRRHALLVRSRGGVAKADDRGPRPSPLAPWQKAQYFA